MSMPMRVPVYIYVDLSKHREFFDSMPKAAVYDDIQHEAQTILRAAFAKNEYPNDVIWVGRHES
jgi:hypothetical protein